MRPTNLLSHYILYSLESDLGLVGNQFQILVSILFATYISVELPSNWVIKKIRPSRWISFITTSWGIVATLSGVTQNFAGMLVCRLLLGAFEGGMWPGLVTYLTFFYTKREIALRIAILFACSALAGACGGLLAFAIGFLDGKYPASWPRTNLDSGANTSRQAIPDTMVGGGFSSWRDFRLFYWVLLSGLFLPMSPLTPIS